MSHSLVWRSVKLFIVGCCVVALLDSVLIVVHFPTALAFTLLVFSLLIIGGVGIALLRMWQNVESIWMGIAFGLILGSIWVIEISFFNFVAPRLLSVEASDIIGDVLDAAIALMVLVVGFVSAYRARHFMVGWYNAVWSAMISSIFVYLMGLLIINFNLDRVVHDVGAMQEYAERGAASGAPDIFTYWADQTLSGAVFHLTLFGIVVGMLLGALGASAGDALAQIRTPK